MATERLREHPADRFAEAVIEADLNEAFEQLPRQSSTGQPGMQKAILRRGSVTTAIFAFEAGGTIPEHTAPGEVMIHCLAGRILINAPDGEHALEPNRMLFLAPGTPHDVRAEEASRMVLHVVKGE